MIIPEIGTVCKYGFITKFAALNGIYSLTEKMSFNTAVENKVDFIAKLYTYVNLTSSDFEDDSAGYQNDIVLHLVEMNIAKNTTARDFYIPISIIDTIPDPMIKKYYTYALGINLGYIADKDDKDWLVNQLKEIASSVTGTTSDVALFATSEGTYMAEADYQVIEDERRDRVTSLTTNYSNLQKQLIINQQLKTQIKYLEDLIISLQSGG